MGLGTRLHYYSTESKTCVSNQAIHSVKVSVFQLAGFRLFDILKHYSFDLVYS